MQTRLMFSAAVLVALAGCASVPTGPNVMALPGTGTTFEQFRYDDMMCFHFHTRKKPGIARRMSTLLIPVC